MKLINYCFLNERFFNKIMRFQSIQQFGQFHEMQQNISTQIQLLEKQLQDSLKFQFEQSQNATISKGTQNQGNLPKMQQMMKIFINSLKLNQKLYNSIVEKQAKINSGTNSLLEVSAQTDLKVQEALKRTKQLYEDTVHQNQKARFMLEQFIAPIRQQIKSKVDETTFTLQMKMLLDEYDVMGHQISYDVTEEQKVKEEKRKSVNSQTLSFLKDKILPVLSHIEQRLQSTIEKGTVMSNKIEKIATRTNEMESKLNIHQEFIDMIQSKNLSSMGNQGNDQQTDKKMKQSVRFMIKEYSNEMQGTIDKINRSIKNLESSLTNQIQTIKTSLTNSITNHKASQTFIKTQLDKHQKKISEHSNSLQQHQLQFQALAIKLKNNDSKLDNANQISQKVQNLTQKIQNGQFKNKTQLQGSQFQNLFKRLNEFDADSRKIKTFLKDSQQRNMILKGQLQGIRDILSKKANFSDILLHVQNKVDRRQFKQLKAKLFDEQKDRKGQIKNNSMLLSKESEGSRSWKKRHIKSRSFFSPYPGEKRTDLESEPQEVKRFKLGFNHEFLLSNDMLKKQFSKTQYLRKSIVNNNSNIQNHNTQT